MQQLTPEGQQRVSDLSHRYFVSTDAVMTLLQALVNGHGTMAQFYHPELGGGGQWMLGGMTMIGDMFNSSLKAKVEGLCSELSSLLAGQPFADVAGEKLAAHHFGKVVHQIFAGEPGVIAGIIVGGDIFIRGRHNADQHAK